MGSLNRDRHVRFETPWRQRHLSALFMFVFRHRSPPLPSRRALTPHAQRALLHAARSPAKTGDTTPGCDPEPDLSRAPVDSCCSCYWP
ncbi:hypothetical protein RRG08_012931 [Elysia crispata]|uniref:Uncharacterized protein n=1 Tax=Elysia crispata TaxID=231223 RepID=A0AAE1A0H1_9GAST|nr:hypothetical protein RRG08_012931 [Elysia crispata]